ncbi:MAG: DUF2252 family protein [Vulcanimicrobiota bacterium]
MTIRSLSHLPLAQHGRLPTSGRNPVAASDPVEQVEFEPRPQFRAPAEALKFMADFNSQLGISEEMVAEKNQLMAESSHAFFRASPALFYHDLHTTYQNRSKLLPDPAPTVAVLGDAHALNAGTFRGPEGQTVWGLNDFDQAEMGSPEWDLERLGVSLYVAARSGGETAEDATDLVRKMGRAYLEGLSDPGPSYLQEHEVSGRIRKLVEKSGAKTQGALLEKWTDGNGKLKRDEELVEPDAGRGAELKKVLQAKFPSLKFLDLASKPHSGGSTRGLERYYSLVESPDRAEPWILEIKAVLPSPVQVPDGDLSRGDGEKVLELQRLMGGQVDGPQAFQLGKIAFFTREREREKGSLKDKPEHLQDSAEAIGKLLARAHSGSKADIKGWVDSREDQLLENLVSFSRTYARQVESDFREWQAKYSLAG